MEPRDEWRTADTDALLDALLLLENRDEAARFLRDLCTYNEIVEFSQRWAVARRLQAGQPYRQIAEEIGVSTATISRVNQWLQHGLDGYRMILDRLAEREASR